MFLENLLSQLRLTWLLWMCCTIWRGRWNTKLSTRKTLVYGRKIRWRMVQIYSKRGRGDGQRVCETVNGSDNLPINATANIHWWAIRQSHNPQHPVKLVWCPLFCHHNRKIWSRVKNAVANQRRRRWSKTLLNWPSWSSCTIGSFFSFPVLLIQYVPIMYNIRINDVEEIYRLGYPRSWVFFLPYDL